MPITIKATISSPIEKVWEFYNNPEHVKNWNNASEDWHTPSATNDLQVGGRFSYRMESKDGAEGFDFEGTYEELEVNKTLAYKMDDGRKVRVSFEASDDEKTDVTVTFDPESENDPEFQKEGWQGILDNFKGYCEDNI